jgi:hypothetical protein
MTFVFAGLNGIAAAARRDARLASPGTSASSSSSSSSSSRSGETKSMDTLAELNNAMYGLNRRVLSSTLVNERLAAKAALDLNYPFRERQLPPKVIDLAESTNIITNAEKQLARANTLFSTPIATSRPATASTARHGPTSGSSMENGDGVRESELSRQMRAYDDDDDGDDNDNNDDDGYDPDPDDIDNEQALERLEQNNGGAEEEPLDGEDWKVKFMKVFHLIDLLHFLFSLAHYTCIPAYLPDVNK